MNKSLRADSHLVCTRRLRHGAWFSAVCSLGAFSLSTAVGQDSGVDLCSGVVCESVDFCHDVGVCDPETGLCSQPVSADGAPCDDYTPTTYDDVCLGGVCVGTFDPCFNVSCFAIDECHDAGTCDRSTGLCSRPAKPDGTECYDYHPATYDDICVGGECGGTYDPCFYVYCTPIDECHVAGVCDRATGGCSQLLQEDGAPCFDYNPSTINDVCTNGVCAGIFNLCVNVECVPLDSCQQSYCEPLTGDCVGEPLPNGTMCDDDDPDTIQDECQDGVCIGHEDLCWDVVCDPIDQCNDSECDSLTGECVAVAVTDGVLCDDGWVGTDPDTCSAGVCVGISLYLFDEPPPSDRNDPEFRRANARAVVPVHFSLGGDFGVDILADGYPKSSPVECGVIEFTLGVESTVSHRKKELAYNAETDLYTYVWKPDRSWRGSCRQIVLQFNDGSVYRANFRFR